MVTLQDTKIASLKAWIVKARTEATAYKWYDIIAIYNIAEQEFRSVNWQYDKCMDLINYNINFPGVPIEWKNELYSMRNKLLILSDKVSCSRITNNLI